LVPPSVMVMVVIICKIFLEFKWSLFSRNNPDLLDAGLTSFSQWNETAQHEIQKSGFMNNFMQMEDFQKFKVIVDIDGNSWSSRFVSLLCMNSIFLKVVPYYVDYFFFELQPWVQYIPVNGDPSDLEEIMVSSKDDRVAYGYI
jgi:protein glucosyltransferase